jgi:very-short-patch-repair endonuclease
MNRVWDEVFSIAEEQHAAITSAQIADAGGDRGWVARARRDRLLDPVMRGAFGVIPLLDEWTVMAAAQLIQPRAVAGFSAAARLQRYDGVEWTRNELLVPRGLRVRGLATHEVSDLVVPEIVVIDGLRCTDEIRTIIDYAAVVDDEHVERAIESLLRRHPEAEELLRDRARALARPGKSGPSRVLRVLDRRPAVPTDSDLETVYWQTLRHYGVELPVRQYPVGPYKLDQAYPDIKLFIELDGWGAHGSREAFGRDRRRQNAVVAQDWVPLRFTDSDVRHFGRRTAFLTNAEVTRRRARGGGDGGGG